MLNHSIKLSLADQIWWLLVLLAIASRLFISWDEDFGFRQTQVALTAYWFVRDGINLLYPQMPLFGCSGTVLPFEFPLFQGIVATIALLLKLSSPKAVIVLARLVNFAFFLACAPVLFQLIKREISSSVAKITILLWLTLPYIFFWSRESMIEFCALFWSLLYINSMLDLLRDKKTSAAKIVLTLIYGVLAFTVKATTPACILPSLVIFILYRAAQSVTQSADDLSANTAKLKQYIQLLITPIACVAIPMAVGYAWVIWTDLLKSQNILAGISLTSESLKNWNYGTFSQRLNIYTWRTMFGHYIFFQILGWAGVPFAILGLLRSTRSLARFLLILPVFVGVLAFTNLFLWHSYYYTAIVPYILIALALGIDQLVSWCFLLASRLKRAEEPGMSLTDGAKLITTLTVVSLIWAELCLKAQSDDYTFTNFIRNPFAHNASNNQIFSIAEVVKSHSKPDDWILVIGADWESEIPFYSERRAVMFPDWLLFPANKEALGPLHKNMHAWLEVRKTPIKLFVQTDLPHAWYHCPFAQRVPACTLIQTNYYWIGRCYRDTYDQRNQRHASEKQ